MSNQTILQKAVTPQQLDSYLRSGFDRVSGFTLRAADGLEAATPAALFQAHALGFDGSPFSADDAEIHVLLFPAQPQMHVEDAIGGNDKEGAEKTGGPFVEPAPFTGTGFAPWPGHVVPVYWVRHSRVPAGSELHRVTAVGERAHVATFVDTATGWQAAPGLPALTPPAAPLPVSRLVGPTAVYQGGTFAADPLLDGESVALCAAQETDGFERTPLGRYRRVVPMSALSELTELVMTGTVAGLPVRVVDVYRGEEGPLLWVSYTEHLSVLAEAFGLRKIDAGVYEMQVPADALRDSQTVQLAPRSWATASSAG
ncbi:hypothetical protein APR04_003464 [Promicromonospora umidemergens]|uniref:Acetoacetate decarboxylase n=1 Tax=Promicromonospora umidemergens TaxID=629679 RepID=A0ABP8Y2Y3_9MICO|nr:hypothetical protein [Promicromonospora umidemergens]MCP2284541.1 hypothetical protein [Promicromonospora umidemergens]